MLVSALSQLDLKYSVLLNSMLFLGIVVVYPIKMWNSTFYC